MNGPVDQGNSASGNTELRLFGKVMSKSGSGRGIYQL